MVQYGNSFTMMDLYKMPTYLRQFYYNKLVEVKKREHNSVKESSAKQSKVRIKR